MTAEVLAGYIGGDIVSRTAADVMTANAGMFASVNDVEPYMFMCVMDLMGLSTQAELQERIVARYGSSLNINDFGIDISTELQEQAIGNVETDNHSDFVGAEFSLARILVRLQEPSDDSELNFTKQIDLRIRYILTKWTRAYSKGVSAVNLVGSPNKLDPYPFDKSVSRAQGVDVTWMKNGNAENVLERVSIYSLNYVRLFPR